MARIRPTWTPESFDPGVLNHALGFDFSSSVAITISGLWWWQGSGGNVPPSVTADLYVTSGQALVASSGSVSTTGFTVNAWNFVTFPVPFNASAITSYTASIFCVGATAYDGNDLATAITDPTGKVTIPSGGGRFINNPGSSGVFPTSTWIGMHGVDVEFTFTGSGIWTYGYNVVIG